MILPASPPLDIAAVKDEIRSELRLRHPVRTPLLPSPPELPPPCNQHRLGNINETLHWTARQVEGVTVPEAAGLPMGLRQLFRAACYVPVKATRWMLRKQRAFNMGLLQTAEKVRDGLAETDDAYRICFGRVIGSNARLREMVGELAAALAETAAKLDESRGQCDELAARVRTTEDRLDRLRPIDAAADLDFDDFYLKFENRFRGTREQIRERLAVYLPILAKGGLATAEMPALDIGCGRGEWLELLRDEGHIAHGIDINAKMVAECVHHDLTAAVADVLDHLRAQPANSLGLVTGFHIVEHLPFAVLVQVLDQALRVLKPGGACIFETPNPGNLIVGSCNFHYDPTHLKPLPPEYATFTLQHRGFADVSIMPLHPFPDEFHLKVADADCRGINDVLYGPQDFAVIGHKQ